MSTFSLRALARVALFLCVLAPASLAQKGDPQRGVKLFDERNFPAARAEFAAVLGRDARDANALYYMGRIALAEDRPGEAIDWFEKAVKANDKSSEYHLWLANALGEEAQRANKLRQPFLARRVKTEYDRAVQLDPRSVAARRGLMDFYVIAPGVMGGSKEKAREQAAEIAKISPLQGRFAAASIAQREKNAEAAEREYVAAVSENLDSTVAHLALSVFYQNAQRWADAFGVSTDYSPRSPTRYEPTTRLAAPPRCPGRSWTAESSHSSSGSGGRPLTRPSRRGQGRITGLAWSMKSKVNGTSRAPRMTRRSASIRGTRTRARRSRP